MERYARAIPTFSAGGVSAWQLGTRLIRKQCRVRHLEETKPRITWRAGRVRSALEFSSACSALIAQLLRRLETVAARELRLTLLWFCGRYRAVDIQMECPVSSRHGGAYRAIQRPQPQESPSDLVSRVVDEQCLLVGAP